MNNIQKYPAYKDSGVEWIGDIPEHWESLKLKHIFVEKKKKTNPTLNCGSISFGKVVTKADEKIPEATKASYQEVLKGDFLINPLNLNFDLISLRIALSEIDVVVSSGYIVLNNQKEIDRSYYKWLLHRYDVAYMKLLGSGVRQTINFNHIADSILAFPPIAEQTAIANFLDNKTALIDKAIALKEKQIELLKERRRILIHRAVTRGIGSLSGAETPYVKLKDSGVEWIGDIPEHWEVARVKQFTTKISKGTTPSTEGRSILDEGPIRYIKGENIQEGKIIDTPAHFIDEKTNALISRSELKENDVLFVIAGATLGKIAIIQKEHIPSNTNQAVAFLRPNSKIIPQYLAIWLSSKIITELIWLEAVQSAQPNLSMENLGNFPIIVPEIKEQSLILRTAENINSKISTAISLKEKEIEKLKEYKSVLINEAVSGKIKVN